MMETKTRKGMSERSIKAKIVTKLTEFLGSIADPDIADIIRENSIISGGAIASMLLGEKVNDYDIYLKNIDAAIAVSNYFIKRDIEKRSIAVSIKEVENIKRETEKRVFYDFPGGIIRALHPDGSYSIRAITSNALTLSDDVQLITRFYGTPEEIHRNFDFIHCTNYYDCLTGKLVLNIDAMHSLMSKRLYYAGSLYPIASLLRIRKFLDRDWTISAGQVAKISLQLTDIQLTPSILAEQLLGVDLLYMSAFLEKLQFQEGEELDMGLVATLLDEVFD